MQLHSLLTFWQIHYRWTMKNVIFGSIASRSRIVSYVPLSSNKYYMTNWWVIETFLNFASPHQPIWPRKHSASRCRQSSISCWSGAAARLLARLRDCTGGCAAASFCCCWKQFYTRYDAISMKLVMMNHVKMGWTEMVRLWFFPGISTVNLNVYIHVSHTPSYLANNWQRIVYNQKSYIILYMVCHFIISRKSSEVNQINYYLF